MSYIGRPLQVANLAVMSGVGDGSDVTPIATLDYATTTNGIAVYLDGVRQLAGTDFNVTAQTTLTFTTAPANGVGIDVYFLGLELSIPTPADATVTTAKIANNAVDETKLKDALIGDFTEVTVQASDSFLLGDADGTTKRDTIQGVLDLVPAGGLTSETGSFTRDISTATGSQAVTGVGFQPTALIVFVGGGGVGRASWGMASSDATEVCVNHYHNITTDSFEHWGNLIRLEYGSGENYQGNLTSFDADGFTIAWTKNGSPTGTVGCKFIAFK